LLWRATVSYRLYRTVVLAKERSLERGEVEVCRGSLQAVQWLTETVSSATPKDHPVWRGIANVLQQQFQEKDSAPSVQELKQ
jgi:hypothetical protein